MIIFLKIEIKNEKLVKYLTTHEESYVMIIDMENKEIDMLISKWVVMKAFIDSDNILTVIILAYGSAVTLFYWTKWMGKLVSNEYVPIPE